MCREMCYLEGRNEGNIGKSVYFSYKSWILASFKQPERNTLGHLHVHYDNNFGPLFELPERNMLLATSYWEVITQPSFTELGCWQQVWQSTLPEHSPLNSLLMEWCSAVCPWALLHNFLTTVTFMFTWDLEPKWQNSISSSDCRLVAILSLKDTHTGSFSSSLWLQLCLSICVFWKHSCLLIQARKSPDRVISPTQGNKRYGRSSHRTFFPELFSKEMVLCILGVSLHSSEAVGKCFSEPRTWGLKTKQHLPNKTGRVAIYNLMEERTWHSSHLQDHKSHQVLVLSGRNTLLAISLRKVLLAVQV